MPADRRSDNPDAAAAAYWRSVAALSEASEREAAATREAERDQQAIDAATRQEGDAERAPATRSATAARRTRPRL